MALPLILGHRGDPRRRRENTLAAFEAAMRAGAEGIEIDVRACQDALVIHHDPNLRKGRRMVPLQSLRRAELPPWIPTLSEVVTWAARKGPLVDVEIKEPGIEARAVEEAARITDHCVFTSFHPDVAYAIREKRPDLRCGWITKEPLSTIATLLAELRPGLLVLPARRCTKAAIAAARAADARVWAWNVNTVSTARRLSSLGVEAFITDAPARLAAWKAKLGRPRRSPDTDRRESSAGSARATVRRTRDRK